MKNFERILPCGLNREVTCVEDCVQNDVSVDDFGEVFSRAFEVVFRCELE